MRNRFNADLFKCAVLGLIQESKLDRNYDDRQGTQVHNRTKGLLVIDCLHEPQLASMIGYSNFNDNEKVQAQAQFERMLEHRKAGIDILVRTLREWLDGYDIQFSGSEIRYGEHERSESRHLRVQVSYSVEQYSSPEYEAFRKSRA